MANSQHLTLLRRGVMGWNQWRRTQNPSFRPDLSKVRLREAHLRAANLSGVILSGADLSGADLSGADLSNAVVNGATLIFTNLSDTVLNGAVLMNSNLSRSYLGGADLNHATLSGADLRGSNLSGAILSGADLSGTNLSNAILDKANLSEAVLSNAVLDEANLSEATLSGTQLNGADLSNTILNGAILTNSDLNKTYLSRTSLNGADLSKAKLGWTTFVDIDLRTVKGLETVEHTGPSTIGIDTVYRSQGQIPETFLRGAGIPDTMIDYMHSLVGKPVDFYSCFISYSSQDQEFAEHLYADLQNKGVRCWYAQEDMKIGDEIRTRIDESIKRYDKLLLVLSEHALESTWVKHEVEAAFDKEARQHAQVLFPIRVDDMVMQTDKAWAITIRREKHIGDFTKWKQHGDYQQALERLLRDLKAEA